MLLVFPLDCTHVVPLCLLLFRQITAVCILLCVLFAVKAVYLIGMGIGYMDSEEASYRSRVGVHHIAFEFAMHFSTEFVPGALLIFFTRQSSKPDLVRSTSANSASASGQPTNTTTTNNNSNSYLKPMTPSYSFRVRNTSQNNSAQSLSSNPYPEDAAPMLSGYQYQVRSSAPPSPNLLLSLTVSN